MRKIKRSEIIMAFACLINMSNAIAQPAEPSGAIHYMNTTAPQGSYEIPAEVYNRLRMMDSLTDMGRYDLYQMADPTKKTRAILWVSFNHEALIEQQAFFEKEEKISLEQATLRFGKPRMFGSIAIFDLIANVRRDPTFFHVDIKFDDKKIAQQYKLRGLGIAAKSQFIDVDVAQIGKHKFPETKLFTPTRRFVVDKSGQTLGKGFERLMPFNEGRAVVRIGTAWGYINTEGKIVQRLIYRSAQSFSEGLGAVRYGQKVGYVDKDDVTVIPFKFDDASAFKNGLAAAKVDKLWGYIDKKGVFVIQPQYDEAQDFSDGFAVVQRDNMQGYIDTTGTVIGGMKFTKAYAFKNGFGIADVPIQ